MASKVFDRRWRRAAVALVLVMGLITEVVLLGSITHRSHVRATALVVGDVGCSEIHATRPDASAAEMLAWATTPSADLVFTRLHEIIGATPGLVDLRVDFLTRTIHIIAGQGTVVPGPVVEEVRDRVGALDATVDFVTRCTTLVDQRAAFESGQSTSTTIAD